MNNKMKKLIFKVATTTIVSVFVVALAAGAATTVGDAITTTGLITGSLGATVTGATVNLNASSNFDVNVATGTSTGDITLGGGTAGQLVSINSDDWDISTAGVMTGIGAITSDGLITGSLGATISGAITSINASSNFATNINTGTSSGALSLGGGSGTVAINSSDWDIDATGAMTGIGSITSDGTITATTFIGALTGNVTGNVSGTSGSTTGNAATVADGVYTTDTGTVTSLMLQAAAADLGAADVEVVLSNTNAGGFNTNITTDGAFTSGILRIPREEAAGPTNATAPAATCDAANLGAIVMVEEKDAAKALLWGCEETVADTTYAWINLSIQP